MNSLRLITITILVTLSLTGCTAANSGRVTPSLEVTESFTNYRPLDDHRYYYFGSQNRPQVIVGIHKRYVFSSKFWREFDPEGDGLKKRVNYMLPDVHVFYKGYSILDPGGNPVGVWYSHREYAKFATIKFGEDNHVIIYAPKSEEEIRRYRFKDF